ncbi:molybdate ABC transporter substrate-binding protein [Testudinibacter sp. TR-2022]|uniref:molybdate ABC transporter substrate-binding protein n=1 Tax=Testudinibacter sp. TR-2022 TaxID=2585029 RepID=UPI00111AD641|nr:molybdate ABC transporter substrate-binding protein [Testudinibacter sp. TR-2022]TNH09020.1 molybdate ABC transporter substrate-binding protein [Pasteurellaceae bacterium Phil11]TNH25647.1 molybdate ABC transporter substrate-binding protein [Testudinibacter sp. TR-2022]TNH29188.1 molybdate ABC transporter substrate-binding protein [Testudinibacter sp. TR-2022]
MLKQIIRSSKSAVLALALAAVSFSGLANDKLTVFAAASMTNVLQDLATEFKQEQKEAEIVFSFASSSVLARQIDEGAPADIFVSANLKWADFLQEKGKIIVDSRKIIAGNKLVMIAPKSAGELKFDLNSEEWLKYLGKHFLSVGDPEHVPVGIYAKAALTKLNQWDKVEKQLARAANVRAALTLVERGEAPLGIVYATDAAASDKVQIVGVFPDGSYEAVEYPAAIVNGHDSETARAFMAFLGTDNAKAVLQKYGFSVE